MYIEEVKCVEAQILLNNCQYNEKFRIARKSRSMQCLVYNSTFMTVYNCNSVVSSVLLMYGDNLEILLDVERPILYSFHQA